MTPVMIVSRRRHLASWQFPVGRVLFQDSIYQMTGSQRPKNLRKYFSLLTDKPETYLFVHRFLYALTICVDACFRFKNRLRSSDAKDPTLGPGWSYMIDHGPYQEHIKKYANEEEVSPNQHRCYII